VPARLGRPARRPAQGKPARGWPENGARQRRRPGPGISAVCLHLRCLLFLLQSPRSRAAASPGEQQQGHHTGLAVDAGEKPGEKPAEMETGVHKVLDPLVTGVMAVAAAATSCRRRGSACFPDIIWSQAWLRVLE
jgi:hypothetical protein